MGETNRQKKVPSHDEAMDVIRAAGRVTTLSYEEAVAIYLRYRMILRDGQEMLGSPVPADWAPRIMHPVH